ncbi:ras-related protein RABH1b-like [Dendronephthya gigantea]|uniref:ras-related protein RABH1b-like n=1 Tax=Dendronephthya gigantea TaxID=151771 RepID=UPI00106CD965|nr:ras-related protein RABH1b-like [Dendronephthya gigantea]
MRSSMEAENVEHKLIVLGNQGVGKTALVTRLVYDVFEDINTSTIGMDFFTKTIFLEDRPIRFKMWDTAGQERFHCLLPAYLRDSTIALIVYDITKKASFDDVSNWMLKIRSERGNNVVIILIGNKSDAHANRQVEYEEALTKAEMMNISFIETSAKTGANINELLQMILFPEQPYLRPYHTIEKTWKEKILLGGGSASQHSLNKRCSC